MIATALNYSCSSVDCKLSLRNNDIPVLYNLILVLVYSVLEHYRDNRPYDLNKKMYKYEYTSVRVYGSVNRMIQTSNS